MFKEKESMGFAGASIGGMADLGIGFALFMSVMFFISIALLMFKPISETLQDFVGDPVKVMEELKNENDQLKDKVMNLEKKLNESNGTQNIPTIIKYNSADKILVNITTGENKGTYKFRIKKDFYGFCRDIKIQSPINIVGSGDKTLEDIYNLANNISTLQSIQGNNFIKFQISKE